MVSKHLEYDFGVQTEFVQFEKYPSSLAGYLELAERETCIIGGHRLADFASVWWRRPGDFGVSDNMPDEASRRFAIRECDSFLRGALLATDVLVINDPVDQYRAAYKPVQLSDARRAGFSIPQTIMGNDAGAVRDFWNHHNGQCVYKTFRSFIKGFSPTRMLDGEAMSLLDALQHGPVIVQELVPKGIDVRINVFGREVYAAEVAADDSVAAIDWRLDPMAVWTPHDLPSELVEKIYKFMCAMRLRYGCIDMRLRPNGEYVFFEVNPAGQFLFVEMMTDQPLSAAMARLLAHGADKHGSPTALGPVSRLGS